jgi:hypothetical protein
MRRTDIELWVHRVAQQVECNQHTEDSLVELKARWPSPADAARRIAAHANAARGESILWIFGLDEKSGPCGADPVEFSNWFAAVKKHFESAYPEPRDVNVTLGTAVVVAVLFATDRAPYVVRNEAYGKGGSVEWEVPWREARSTRSARRDDLLRLLAPLVNVPEIEVLDATLAVREEWTETMKQRLRCYFEGSLYVVPKAGAAVVYPFHRCSASVKLDVGDQDADQLRVHLSTWGNVSGAGGPIEASGSEITVLRPGTMKFTASKLIVKTQPAWPNEAECKLRLCAVGAMDPAVISFNLSQVDHGNESVAVWSLRAT